jgi:hypothetical protein
MSVVCVWCMSVVQCGAVWCSVVCGMKRRKVVETRATHLIPKLSNSLSLLWISPVWHDSKLWSKPTTLLLPVVQSGGGSHHQEGTPDALYL